MRFRGLAGALVGAVSVAVSLGMGACFQSLDGYAGPPEHDDGSSPDALTSTADALTADAPVLGDAGDAEAGPFCPTTLPAGTLFCEAFDGVNPGLPVNQAKSSLSLVSTPFLSPPNAMRVDIEPLTGVSTVARLRKSFDLTPSRLRVRADVNVSRCAGNTNAFSLFFAIDADRFAALAFSVQDRGLAVVNQVQLPNGTDDFATVKFVGRTWPTTSFMHVELTWHDDFTADLSVDGATILNRAKLLGSWAKGKVSLEYGNSYSNGAGDCHFTIDNVLVDGQ